MGNRIDISYLELSASFCKSQSELFRWHDGAISTIVSLIFCISNEEYDIIKSTIDDIYLEMKQKIK